MNEKATKSKIIETMYNLIAEKGYDKASMGQIADIIGIKKASVYYYFKSKEEILIQIVKNLYSANYFNASERFKEEIKAENYEMALITVGENFIDSYFENHNLRKVYAEIDIQTSRVSALKAIVKESDASFNKFLIACLSYGAEIGAFNNDFDVSLNAQILYTVLVGIDQAILYELPINPKLVWKEVILKLFEKRECQGT